MVTKDERIKIANRNYGSLADQPLYITVGLRERLQNTKRRDGTAYDLLLARGFRGGKHLIEILREKFGNDVAIVLSDKASISEKRVTIDYPRYLESGQQRFLGIYRETGLKTASGYLSECFPERFAVGAGGALPGSKEIRSVFRNLPEAVDSIPKKDKALLPQSIAELIERQGPDFVLDLLQTMDAAVPKGQDRLAATLKEVVGRLAKEGATALGELADLMDRLSLYQVTSLINILRHRLATIETFATLIEDDATYELKTDRSVHRILEKSMWLLNDEYWIAQSNRTLNVVIGKELAKQDKTYRNKRPDFACVDALGKTVLVEIKRPSIELRKDEVDQAELYLRIVSKNTGDRRKPTVFLVGRQVSVEAQELSAMRGYPTILTYQEMIEGARRRYQEYLQVTEMQT